MCIYLDKKIAFRPGRTARARAHAARGRDGETRTGDGSARSRALAHTDRGGRGHESAVKVEATTERSVWRFKESSPHFWTPSPRRQPRWSTNLGTDVDQNFPLPSAVYKIEQE